ncbi:hypothetical protein HUT19_41605 (plasmid) [Streptomyces sp. NA02950]|uniref:hypothetical protein n=1 Tax=Streptomyces sp. NA02950 TaxID=2742137 RepID=UPI0015905A20|nr:hypothetical protein [Streptomyces sp. NA02950]QKV98219.1 hypothetical protein HUT19_41605 [Streptomyces sp. NA02950]
MAASADVRHPMLPELYDRIDSFVQARLEEARRGVPAGSDTALALDALQYLASRAAAAGDLMRTGIRTHTDQAVRQTRAEEAWEMLRHIARRWHEHPDYTAEFAPTWRDLVVEENRDPSATH